MQSNGFDRKMISGDLKKNIFSNPKGGPLCFQKRKSALVGFFLEKNPMTNKIEKFLYILEHLIPDGRDEIPTFALYHPLLIKDGYWGWMKIQSAVKTEKNKHSSLLCSSVYYFFCVIDTLQMLIF